MKRREQRRILSNITWQAERYFTVLQFVIVMMTMVYLLYLIFGTVNGVLEKMPAARQVALAPVFDQINFLLLIRVSILFFLVFFINFLLGLFFLHRLTGPLLRLRVILTQIAQGTIQSGEVMLRKGDFPAEVAKALSGALKQIREWKKSG